MFISMPGAPGAELKKAMHLVGRCRLSLERTHITLKDFDPRAYVRRDATL